MVRILQFPAGQFPVDESGWPEVEAALRPILDQVSADEAAKKNALNRLKALHLRVHEHDFPVEFYIPNKLTDEQKAQLQSSLNAAKAEILKAMNQLARELLVEVMRREVELLSLLTK